MTMSRIPLSAVRMRKLLLLLAKMLQDDHRDVRMHDATAAHWYEVDQLLTSLGYDAHWLQKHNGMDVRDYVSGVLQEVCGRDHIVSMWEQLEIKNARRIALHDRMSLQLSKLRKGFEDELKSMLPHIAAGKSDRYYEMLRSNFTQVGVRTGRFAHKHNTRRKSDHPRRNEWRMLCEQYDLDHIEIAGINFTDELERILNVQYIHRFDTHVIRWKWFAQQGPYFNETTTRQRRTTLPAITNADKAPWETQEQYDERIRTRFHRYDCHVKSFNAHWPERSAAQDKRYAGNYDAVHGQGAWKAMRDE